MKVRGIKIFEVLGKKKFKRAHKMVIKETSILIGISLFVVSGVVIGMTYVIPLVLPKWQGAISSTILYSFIIPIKLSSSYVAFVVKSPTVNRLKFEPIMQLLATLIMVIGAYLLFSFDMLSLDNFIIVVLIALLFLHIGYIIYYFIKYYFHYVSK